MRSVCPVVQRVEFLVSWQQQQEQEQENQAAAAAAAVEEQPPTWLKQAKCEALGLGQLLASFSGKETITNAGGETLSNGPAKNLQGTTRDLPTAAAAKREIGSKSQQRAPAAIEAVRTFARGGGGGGTATYCKVRWADASQPASWLSREACLAGFGKAKLAKLEKAAPAPVSTETAAMVKGLQPFTAAAAAKRWGAAQRGGSATWYGAVQLAGGQKIALGDAVKVVPDEAAIGAAADSDGSSAGAVAAAAARAAAGFELCIVEELWQESKSDKGKAAAGGGAGAAASGGGGIRFAGRKLYLAGETILHGMVALDPKHIYAMDPRRVFASKLPQCPLLLRPAAAILEPAAVAYAPTTALKALAAADYFYEMSYDSENHAMEDVRLATPPPAGLKLKPPPQEPPKKLGVLDLYAGTGGLGYLDGEVREAAIETKWAVDFDKAACDSWKKNRPEVHTYHMSVDDFLFLVEKWDALCTKYENYVEEDDSDEEEEAEEPKEEEEQQPAAAAAAAPMDEDNGDAEADGGVRSSRRKRAARVDLAAPGDERSKYNDWLAGENAKKMAAQLTRRRADATEKLATALAAARAAPPAEEQGAKLAGEQAAGYIKAGKFGGAKPGYAFKAGAHGPGYYRDLPDLAVVAAALKTAVVSAVSCQLVETAGAGAGGKQIAKDLEEAKTRLAALEAVLPKPADDADDGPDDDEAAAAGDAQQPADAADAAAAAAAAPAAAAAEGEVVAGGGAGAAAAAALPNGIEAPTKETGKKHGHWSWSSPMAYRVLASAGVGCFNKVGGLAAAGGQKLATLPLGTELQCKTGRIDGNGDSWLNVGKNGGAGLAKSCWVPATAKAGTRILVEEIPVEEWLVDESEEEVDYEIERIVDMRVLNPDKTAKGTGQGVGKNAPNVCKHFHPFAAGGRGRGEAGELEFCIKWKGWGSEYNEWKTEKQLDCPALLARWVRETLAAGKIPRPGDVDLVCGGPPCQVGMGDTVICWPSLPIPIECCCLRRERCSNLTVSPLYGARGSRASTASGTTTTR
eukprot:SAG22_NODE_759_length_7426_cov_15.767572_2_plen_1028_part_00